MIYHEGNIMVSMKDYCDTCRYCFNCGIQSNIAEAIQLEDIELTIDRCGDYKPEKEEHE